MKELKKLSTEVASQRGRPAQSRRTKLVKKSFIDYTSMIISQNFYQKEFFIFLMISDVHRETQQELGAASKTEENEL